MGYEALFEELRRLGEGERQAVWGEAKAAADRYRQAAAERATGEESEAARQLSDACEAIAREARQAADHEIRQFTARAENELAERMLHIARRVMPVLQDEKRREVFTRLTAELPECQWTKVHVNPTDQALARDLFPQSEVVADGDIAGGMEAFDLAGGVRVINTLGKRLERGWPAILPGLFQETRAIVNDRPAE